MSRKSLSIIIISAIAVTLTSGIVSVVKSNIDYKNSQATEANTDNSDFTYISPTLEDGSDTEEDTAAEVIEEITTFVPATELDLDPSSITVFVNKEYALPKDYKPDPLVTPSIRFNSTYYDERTLMRPEASKALEKLFVAADKKGYQLIGISAYRSYDRQYEIFTNNIITQGKTHTLQYSAVPGTSEHQTGLAIDLSTDSLGNKLSAEFADTPEGRWLSKNAYKYGFIIRYPENKADITGYAYEPWHIRYVGRGLSYYLHENDLTLDEYYNYTPSPDFDFEKLYADIINYEPVKATPSITPTTIPVISEAPEEGEGNDGKDTNSDNSDPIDGETVDNSDPTNSKDLSPTPTPTPTPEAALTLVPPEGDPGTDIQNPVAGDGNIGNGTTGITDIIIE